MPEFAFTLPDALMLALEERRSRTGETPEQIVISALADALEVEHATLFQVSNSTALTQGVFDGAVTIGANSRNMATSAWAPSMASMAR